MRFIGDVHGKWHHYKTIASEAEKSIQVGDFGFGFGQSDTEVADMNDFMSGGNHRFIRGNHDNPAVCREMSGYIEDGTIEGDTMFIGGALSIDKHIRTEGVDWWSDEELSYMQMKNMIELYGDTKPRVMVTHECPEAIVRLMFAFYQRDHLSIMRQGFQAMFEIHQPELWIFGHWHRSKEYVYDNTKFICLNELEYIDIDM